MYCHLLELFCFVTLNWVAIIFLFKDIYRAKTFDNNSKNLNDVLTYFHICDTATLHNIFPVIHSFILRDLHFTLDPIFTFDPNILDSRLCIWK